MAMPVPIKLLRIATAVSQPRARNGLSRLDTYAVQIEPDPQIKNKFTTALGLKRCRATVSSAYVNIVNAVQARQASAAQHWRQRTWGPDLIPEVVT